ncbi:MAG: hypothetical protein LBI94_06760, partial [Treponema sp.]|nr:hypothetical protein [Treponema sp.]
IEKLHIQNAFTRAVFFDKTIDKTITEINTRSLNWAKLYPFSTATDTIGSKSSPLKQRIDDIKEKIERYTRENLTNWAMFAEWAVHYEKSIGWNILNGDVIDLGDGYLSEVVEKNTAPPAAGLYAFYDFLQGLGIDLVYVQCPHKITPDDAVSGIADFSNENADDLLSALSVKQIPYLDLRENIREENLDHHGLFYKTDHHWKAETGLWASAVLMNYLNERHGFSFDARGPEHYLYTTYKDWFLGSLGKKVTLAQTQAEDFTLISPKFDTDFSVTIPELNLDARGNFDILIDHHKLNKKDYYTIDPYGAYVYGDRQVITVHNNLVRDGRKILLIKDSFARVVAPFLSTEVEELHILDLRHFNGSARAYIEKHRPDIVVVLFNPSTINYTEHKKMFDFR